MKLIQINAWAGRLIYHLPRFINAEKPDIVCLQEVYDTNHGNPYLFTGLKELAEQAELPHYALSPSFSIGFIGHESNYGVGIMSNRQLDDIETVYVGGQFERFRQEHGPSHARSFQHVSIDAGGKKVHIINYHGTFIRGSKAGTEQTEREIKMLADYALQFKDQPVIITGDFNLEPSSKSLQPLNENFHNLPQAHGITSTYSTVLHEFNVVCDYIFVNDQVQVNSFEVSDAVVADHKALIMEFDVV